MDQAILVVGLVMLVAFAATTWFCTFNFGLRGLFVAHVIVLVAYVMFAGVSAAAGVYEYDGILSVIGLAIQAFLINCLLLPIGLIALWMRRSLSQS